MVVLKLPIAGLLYIVWWAVHQTPETAAGGGGDGDGGSRLREPHRPVPHPRPPLPRLPRRGSHGAATPPPPARIRGLAARTRRVQR